MQLMDRLDPIGAMLLDAVQRIWRRRAGGDAACDAPARHDVDRASMLLGQTMRWMHVLLVRFAANIVAAKDASMRAEAMKRGEIEPPETVAAEAAPKEPAGDEKRGPRAPDPDRAIRRKSILQILERVCADLGEVATLLGETEAAQELAAVAEALHALLDGVLEGVPAVVSPPASGVVVAAGGAGVSMIPAVPPQVRAPDSG